MKLEADLVLELTVEVGETQEVGKTPKGYLRLIPITGGTFSGDNIKGKVLSGGYDWNTAINDDMAHAFAKYTLQTDDGVYISIENEGYIDSKTASNIIKTIPSFQVADGKYDWLRSGVFVGSLDGAQTERPAVSIKIYRLK